MIAFDQPLALILAILVPLPFLLHPERRSPHPAIAQAPRDALSTLVGGGLRGAAMVAIGALVLALAGPHGPGTTVEREGRGANIVFLFDRSSSMDNTFADRRPNGDEQSKSAVAKRLVLDFLDRRPRDRVGVAAFSTTPMMIMPITDDFDAVRAAVSATDRPGLAHTDVGRGLILATDMFTDRTGGESRALILVSDGAGVVGREVQDALRETVRRNPVNLYWLYIRSAGSHGIHEIPVKKSDDTPRARPERHLHLLLQSLHIPYRALEAQSPDAVEQAIAEIDRLESRPIRYPETSPRRDFAPFPNGLAAFCLLVLAAGALLERPLVASATPLPPIRRREAMR